MENNKEIKIYGTLVNHTLDPNKANLTDPTDHHDAIAYAKELYDDRFGMEKAPHNTPCENYQDRINKRVTGITYHDGNPGITTIEGDLVVTGNGDIQNDLNVHNDLHVDENTFVNNLYVSGETDLSLSDLSDVNTNDVRNHQALIYDASTGKWVPGNSDGVKKLDDLEDVDAFDARTGDTIIFDDDTNTWKYGKPVMKLGDLTDVTIDNPEDGSILMYDGNTGKWIPATDGNGDIINIKNIINRIKKLEGMWKWNNETTKAYLEPATNTSTTKVRAHSFYDTSVS